MKRTRSIFKIMSAALIVAGGVSMYALSHTGAVAVRAADEVVEEEVASTIDSQTMVIIERVEALAIDTTIFSDKTFQSLVDYSVTLNPQIPGRANPFAPLGAGSNVAPAKR